MSSVAERLREAMNDAGVDQSALAKAIGVTQGAISLILVGKTRQSKYLPEIAVELGVSYDWLAGKNVAKHSDRPVEASLTPTELAMIQAVREMQNLDRIAVHRVVESIQTASSVTSMVALPSTDALAQMFEGLLEVVDDSTPLAARARELAELLPSGLSAIRGPLIARPSPPARTAAVPALASADREPPR